MFKYLLGIIIFLILIGTFLLFISTPKTNCKLRLATCYLDGNIYLDGTYYQGKPQMDLFVTDKEKYNIINPIVPNDGSKGFFIEAKQDDDTLYVAYQIYKGDLICPFDPNTISSVRVDYEIQVYVLSLDTNKNYALTPINIEQKLHLKQWIRTLHIDKEKGFACYDGKIDYADWQRN